MSRKGKKHGHRFRGAKPIADEKYVAVPVVHPLDDHRLMILPVPYHCLLQYLANGLAGWALGYVSVPHVRLPAGFDAVDLGQCLIKEVFTDFMNREFRFLLWHPKFEVVQQGCQIPLLEGVSFGHINVLPLTDDEKRAAPGWGEGMPDDDAVLDRYPPLVLPADFTGIVSNSK